MELLDQLEAENPEDASLAPKASAWPDGAGSYAHGPMRVTQLSYWAACGQRMRRTSACGSRMGHGHAAAADRGPTRARATAPRRARLRRILLSGR